VKWNLRFPLDRWWRLRHGVRFRSPEHLRMSQVAIHFEHEEEKLFNAHSEAAKKRNEDYEEYVATGVWLKPPQFVKTTEAEEQAVYEDLGDDLSMFDDLPDDPGEPEPEESEEDQDVTL
jgi:hypothetical protein